MSRRRLAAGVLGALALLAGVAYAADAKVLFRARCGVCHGPGGTGTFMLERRLGKGRGLLEERRDLDRTLILHVARHGIQSMPRFSRAELPDTELQAIAEYLTQPGTSATK